MDDADEEFLSDLARRVERRRAAESSDADADSEFDSDSNSEFGAGEGDAPATSPFESMAVDSVDPETLWAELADDRSGTVGVDARAEAVESAPGAREHVVPKRSFCQSCPHFAAPPTFACTREGTDIVEVVDADRFRVRNCPMVGDESDSDGRR
jgi:hypothetical protein